MKKLATAIAAVALIGTPAFAADMAGKRPPPALEPAGAELGGEWADTTSTTTSVVLDASSC